MSDNDKKPDIGPRYYEPEKNPEYVERGKNEDGSPRLVSNPEYIAFMGVPNRDITEDEFAAMPLHIQRTVDASPVHRKTKPRPASKSADTKPEPAKE